MVPQTTSKWPGRTAGLLDGGIAVLDPRHRGKSWLVLWVCCLWFAPAQAHAGEVLVAVAGNFLNPMKEVTRAFEAETGHQTAVSPGSTGKLYAQLRHGAPYEVFLAGDRERPLLLEKAGLAVEGSRFTYAVGRLVLWSRHSMCPPREARQVLAQGAFRHVAIANPKTAPYGKASVQVMQKWGVWEGLRARLVQGENIAQTFQFVASGNADLGFVALSQIEDPRFRGGGTRWDIPENLYESLKQDAVLLKTGRSNPAALALLSFLQTEQARAVIKRYGYRVVTEEGRSSGTE